MKARNIRKARKKILGKNYLDRRIREMQDERDYVDMELSMAYGDKYKEYLFRKMHMYEKRRYYYIRKKKEKQQ